MDNKHVDYADVLIEGYMTAYWYNHTSRECLDLLRDLHNGLTKPESIENEDAFFLRQILIAIIGDWGTSPRYGWFDEADIGPLDEIICEQISNYEYCEGEEGKDGQGYTD